MRASLWTEVELGNVVELQAGFPFSSKTYTDDDSGVRLLRGDNIAQGRLRWDNAKRWPASEVSQSQAYQLEVGDVVVAMDRPWIEAGLKWAWISEEDLPCLLVQRVARLRAGAALNQRFLRYVVGSKAFTHHVLAVQTGTAVPHISGDQIKEFRFLCPSLFEQESIGHVLSSLDDKIEQNRRTSEALERLARAIFRAWFVDFDPVKAKAAGATSFSSMPQDVFDALPTEFADSPIGSIPQGWTPKLIREAAEIVSGGTPSKANAAYWGGEFSWVSAKDMTGRVIAESELSLTEAGRASVRRTAPQGATLMVIRGMSLHSEVRMGICATEVAFNQDVKAFVSKSDVPSSLLYLWLTSSEESLLQMVDTASHGTGRILTDRIETLGLAYARPETIEAFAAISQPMIDLQISLFRESKQLAELRDYLLPKLLSGKVRVRDAERLAESA